MNNKLKIALRCARYMLVAILVALPFVAPDTMEAKKKEGYEHRVFENDICDSGGVAICYNQPGTCPNESIACLVEGWNDY